MRCEQRHRSGKNHTQQGNNVNNVLVTAFLGGDSTWKSGEGQSCINSINVQDTSEAVDTLASI
jgi:hypothetical protein